MGFNSFPFFFNDKQSLIPLTSDQRYFKEKLIFALEKKTLTLKENKCICGNSHNLSDITISEKDRYGFPIPQVLCSKCGLIRSQLVFDDSSNNIFYKDYYRKIYSTSNIEDYFSYQNKRGTRFLNLLKSLKIFEKITKINEIGCGSGGILYPFLGFGKEIRGYDFENDFLEFGQKKGLDLSDKDFFVECENDYCDLVIMSHVMEHLIEPIPFLKKIISKIKTDKYLLIEVPGLYSNPFPNFNPILFFQNAHVIQFYTKSHLTALLESLGLTIIYGDETCTFICQKRGDKEENLKPFFDYDWKDSAKTTQLFLKNCKKKYDQTLPKGLKTRLYNFACMFRYEQIKDFIKMLFRGKRD